MIHRVTDVMSDLLWVGRTRIEGGSLLVSHTHFIHSLISAHLCPLSGSINFKLQFVRNVDLPFSSRCLSPLNLSISPLRAAVASCRANSPSMILWSHSGLSNDKHMHLLQPGSPRNGPSLRICVSNSANRPLL